MALFTVIFEFRGTTAVRQVRAATPKAAAAKWLAALDAAAIPGFGAKGKAQLMRAVETQSPIPVRTTQNVWALSAPIMGHLALVYLTRTEENHR